MSACDMLYDMLFDSRYITGRNATTLNPVSKVFVTESGPGRYHVIMNVGDSERCMFKIARYKGA